MADTAPTGKTAADTWNKLIEDTMWASFAEQASSAQQAAQKGTDPWTVLINQLWQANPYSSVLPIDPAEITRSFQQLWMAAFTNPDVIWANYQKFLWQSSQLMIAMALKFWSQPQEAQPLIEPEKGDKRFGAPDWQQSVVFDALKQSYLLTATTLLKTFSEMQGLDEKLQRKVIFYLRQFLDAISPSNYIFTNPQVLRETMASGGENLVKGMENLLRDMKNGQIKITDTEAFEPGQNLAITPGKVIYRNRLIELIQYAPTTERVNTIPILFVPHWINKYYILDLQPHNSLIKFLVGQGFTVFIISWRNPDASMEDTTFDDYLELGPLEVLPIVREITDSPKINAVGYCIGGTLLSMVLSYLAATNDETINSATFFVSLLDFSEVGDTSVFIDEPQLVYVEGMMKERGYLDSRSMAIMFNMLRANDLIWSNVVNNYLLGKEPPAFDLLYWNNDGTRMARAAHSFYLRNTYLENNLIKPNKIVLKGVPIDLSRIQQDIYAVGAQQDHIVPWQSAWKISQLVQGPVRFVLGNSGHIAGVINPPQKAKGYWVSEKLAETANGWLQKAEQCEGSWWPDWVKWLQARSGELVPPPPMGNMKYPPMTSAPGTYVLEK